MLKAVLSYQQDIKQKRNLLSRFFSFFNGNTIQKSSLACGILKIEKDYLDFIILLNQYKVNYVITGSYAALFYFNMPCKDDIEFFIENTTTNAEKLSFVLRDFGLKNNHLSENCGLNESTIISIKCGKRNINLVTSLKGLEFNKVFNRRVNARIGNEIVSFIGKKHLVLIKNNKKEKRLAPDYSH